MSDSESRSCASHTHCGQRPCPRFASETAGQGICGVCGEAGSASRDLSGGGPDHAGERTMAIAGDGGVVATGKRNEGEASGAGVAGSRDRECGEEACGTANGRAGEEESGTVARLDLENATACCVRYREVKGSVVCEGEASVEEAIAKECDGAADAGQITCYNVQP